MELRIEFIHMRQILQRPKIDLEPLKSDALRHMKIAHMKIENQVCSEYVKAFKERRVDLLTHEKKVHNVTLGSRIYGHSGYMVNFSWSRR